jgi:predicted signal transduction protein with EAL and GGDEF domain
MLSRENTIILAFVVVATTAAVGIDTVADAPEWLPVGLLIGLGVVVPLLVNSYLDADETS